ncbi:Spc42p NDAI_0K01770 [Naumovozyma dairenensis CBS 421]|uniref:Spindle pole body component SPC42 n=1 Tax=Naumovozyma dairenensis (strain ATCC 10597 / BCRC 20456 / CBS 421 / NBRC 0211 / NRRL Y-12639) TaxID=1071378 RepID=G0WHV7_NAUDC|nr:hypothetical protein NDAI_0K01770 [Naumovozyma dairenensis CBS 421]CCD27368.1 hypothetical protein NDAI_0K01770 [Naumovozyma dairenensis CBS 421]
MFRDQGRNVSPTPRRYHYTSGDNAHYYNYPNVTKEDINGDKLLPKEAKLSTRAIDELIEQNRQLRRDLLGRDEENEKLRILNTSLKNKLIKYTDLNKILQDEKTDLEFDNSNLRKRNDRLRTTIKKLSLSTNILADDADFDVENDASAQLESKDDNCIQIPKRKHVNVSSTLSRNEDMHKSKNSSEILNEKLDKLIEYLSQVKKETGNKDTSSHLAVQPNLEHINPTEKILTTDPVIQESLEIRELEEKVEQAKKKTLLKQENELRKLSLSNELMDLLTKLSVEEHGEFDVPKPQNNKKYYPKCEEGHLNR